MTGWVRLRRKPSRDHDARCQCTCPARARPQAWSRRATRPARPPRSSRPFSRASMVPDPETAACYIADELKITFHRRAKISPSAETRGVSTPSVYKWVEKEDGAHRRCCRGGRDHRLQSRHSLTANGPTERRSTATAYVDRFMVRSGKIVQMDVWNDSAERLLTRAGMDA